MRLKTLTSLAENTPLTSLQLIKSIILTLLGTIPLQNALQMPFPYSLMFSIKARANRCHLLPTSKPKHQARGMVYCSSTKKKGCAFLHLPIKPTSSQVDVPITTWWIPQMLDFAGKKLLVRSMSFQGLKGPFQFLNSVKSLGELTPNFLFTTILQGASFSFSKLHSHFEWMKNFHAHASQEWGALTLPHLTKWQPSIGSAPFQWKLRLGH